MMEAGRQAPMSLPARVAARIRRALPDVAAERLVIAPDCGLK
jgi:5-methyltetrahydropteroyltriglutamate--homocysteine methyltransferase